MKTTSLDREHPNGDLHHGLHFTGQWIKTVRDTCDRAVFKTKAKKMGFKVTGIYRTLGAFDGVIDCEGSDEATATAAMLHPGSLGNIWTPTARAFDAAEMQKTLSAGTCRPSR